MLLPKTKMSGVLFNFRHENTILSKMLYVKGSVWDGMMSNNSFSNFLRLLAAILLKKNYKNVKNVEQSHLTENIFPTGYATEWNYPLLI